MKQFCQTVLLFAYSQVSFSYRISSTVKGSFDLGANRQRRFPTRHQKPRRTGRQKAWPKLPAYPPGINLRNRDANAEAYELSQLYSDDFGYISGIRTRRKLNDKEYEISLLYSYDFGLQVRQLFEVGGGSKLKVLYMCCSPCENSVRLQTMWPGSGRLQSDSLFRPFANGLGRL